MDKLTAPKSKDLQGKLIDGEHERATKRLDRGLMGWLFGLGTEKSGNIAGFVVAFSLALFAVVVVCYADAASLSKKDLLTVIAGFITLSLGYIFGKSSSS